MKTKSLVTLFAWLVLFNLGASAQTVSGKETKVNTKPLKTKIKVIGN